MQETIYSPETTYVHWLPEQHGQPELLGLLDKKEQQRATSFKFDQHRNLYIAAHVFLRKVLSYHSTLPPEDWRFYQTSNGKPYIDNSMYQSMQFNLSHTKGMIVCAVNKTHEVGVDVEGLRPLKYMEQMSRRNYTHREYDDIFSNNSPEKQLQRFYTYWTLKESFVKALGCGLSMPLKKIEFINLKNDIWTLKNNLNYHGNSIKYHYIFSHHIIHENFPVALSVKSDTEAISNANFCFVESNHQDTRQWKTHHNLVKIHD